MSWKPAARMAVNTDSGGGAAAWLKATVWDIARFSSAAALSSVDMTMGAPDKCVTLCSTIASYIGRARTQRRQTCVPATAGRDQVKHQPLQWNMGSVHR